MNNQKYFCVKLRFEINLVQFNCLKMKKILLFACATFIYASTASAQCSPDGQYTTPGFHPDSTSGIQVACETVSYEQIITIIAPEDTVFQGFIIPVDSVTIINVTGLPTGLFTDCEVPNCTWFPAVNQASCISLNGTPPSGTIGDYPIEINYEVYVTLFGFPQSLPLTEGYLLTVEGCAGLIDLKAAGKDVLKVTDLMGRDVVPQTGMLVLYHYSDGTIEKMIHTVE